MDSLAASALGNLSLADYAIIALTAMVASALSTMSGVGGGFVIAAVLAPIVGMKALVPLIAVEAVFSNVNRMIFYWRGVNLRVAMLVLLPSLPGTAIGADIYNALDPGAVAAILGSVLLISVPLCRVLKQRRWVAGTRTLIVVGFFFGIVSGASVGAGLAVIPLLLGAGLMGPALLGTDAVIGAFNSLFRTGTFALHGLLTLDIFIAGILIGICTVPGSWVAAQIVKRTDLRLHTLFMEALILVGGGSFLWRAAGIWGWIGG